MELFKLVGSVYVDTDKANDSLAKTSDKAEKTGSKLGNLAKGAAKVGAGIATVAGAVGGAMIASAKSAASNMDVIDKASQRMKIGAESYQELAHAANLSGVEMTTLEKAAKQLEGTDLNLDDAMASIYELGTAEERSAKAAELFGDTVAYQMTPLLNASSDDMAAMRQEAHDLGLVMDEDTVKAGANMNDMFSKVQDSFTAVVNQIGVKVMPIIAELLQWVIDHMPEITAATGAVFDFVSQAIDEIVPIIKGLMPVFEDVFRFLGHLWQTVLKPVFEAVVRFLNGDFKGAFDSVARAISNIWSDVFNGLVGIVKSPLNKIISTVNGFIDRINSIRVPDWVPGFGGLSAHIRNLPMLAKGGYVTEGEAIVGEAGAELLSVRGGRAQVVPLGGSEKQQKAAANNVTNNININVYAQPDQDVRQLAAVIMDEMQNAINRKGAVFA